MHPQLTNKTLFILTVAGILLLAQGTSRANDWPQMGLDGTRGRASGEVSGAPFHAAWRTAIGAGPFVASPAVADGFVVVAGSQGELRALRAADGTVAWSATAAGPLGASPALDRGRVFVPTLNGRVQALRLADGAPLWQRAFGGQNYGSPAMAGDSLVLAAGFPAQAVARLDAATGATQWQTAPGAVADLVNSSPAVSGGQVLFGMNGGRYQSLDLGTGATSWHVDTAGTVALSAPLVVGNVAYFVPGGKTAALYAADRTTGATLPGWPVAVQDANSPAKFSSSRTAVSSPARLGDLVVFQARFEYDIRPDSDGAGGLHTLHEVLVAVDAATARVVWQQQAATRDISSINEVPELGMSPTPASFLGVAGPLVAVASSISPAVRVFDAAGAELWSATLSAPTRSSPVLANGLLLVATDAGVVHAFQSAFNRAPAAPAGFAPAGGELVETVSPTLRWAQAEDAEGGALHYQVRIDTDGEVLQSWLAQIESDGAPQVVVPHGMLQPGGSYAYAVRARDPQGAWSSWSELQSFTVAVTPTIDVGGTSYDSLDEAIASAAAGSTVTLGRGLLRLAAPVQLPAGVSLAGAGAHQTVLDASRAGVGIQVTASARAGATAVSGVTVAGGEVGIQIVDVENVAVRNVILHDNHRAGIEVAVGAGAELVNATLVRNGTGALSYGKLAVRNSIVSDNGVGLARAGDGTVASRYNDLFANTTAAYQGIEAGVGDISAAVRFASADHQDFRLIGLQPTTDRGDPADDFAAEPAPNGARVNMGAFANTTSAEPSTSSPGWTPAADEPASGGGAGCSMGGTSRPSSAWVLLAMGALILIRRRKHS